MNYAETTYIDVVIANGATTSGEADLSSGRTLVGIIFPGTLTSTTMTFTMSDISGGTFVAVYDESTAYSLTIAASHYHAVKPATFAGVRFIKVVAGSSEGAARTIRLVVRNV